MQTIPGESRFTILGLFGMLAVCAAAVSAAIARTPAASGGFAGSRSRLERHERFYKLWSTSFHGLAMQPYSRDLAAAKLSAQKSEIAVGKYRYRADISGQEVSHLSPIRTEGRNALQTQPSSANERNEP